MAVHKWKVLSSRVVSDNPYLPLRADVCLLPTGERTTYYHSRGGPDAVWVVPFTPEGKVVLIRQYRHGAMKVFTEVPAGMRKRGERPELCARRELKEETGYAAGKLFHLERAYFDPSRSDGKCDLFAALNCRKVSGQTLDRTEDLEALLSSPKKALAKVRADPDSNRWTVHALMLARERFPKLFKK